MKKLILSTLILMIFISAIPGVVAQESVVEGIATALDTFVEAVEPITSYLLGEATEGKYLFAKTLLLVIVLAIVWAVLKQVDFFNRQQWVLWLVSIAVAILSVRWFTEEVIETILLPYSTLGVVISAGLPFVIFFFVVSVGLKKAVPTVRRLAWLLFALVFTGLWFSRIGDMENYAFIYLIFAIASFVMIKFDGTINRLLEKVEMEKKLSFENYREYTRLLVERDEVQDALLQAKKEGDRPDIVKEGNDKLFRINGRLAQLYRKKK
jgi:hypothetical protein